MILHLPEIGVCNSVTSYAVLHCPHAQASVQRERSRSVLDVDQQLFWNDEDLLLMLHIACREHASDLEALLPWSQLIVSFSCVSQHEGGQKAFTRDLEQSRRNVGVNPGTVFDCPPQHIGDALVYFASCQK